MENNEEQWDLEIRPKPKWLDFNLSEVWRYRDLLLLFVRRDFVAQYKQTILGPFWHLLQPIFTTAIFLLLFGRIARLSTDGIPPTLFYLTNITFWNFFSSSLTATANTFTANASIFGKVYFPRLVMPLSVMLSNLIRFGIQFALLICAIVYFQFHGFEFHFSFRLLGIIPLVACLALTGLGLGIMMSSLTTKYRDLSVLLMFAVQLGMYATPVVYPMSFVTDPMISQVLHLNPLSSFFEGFRYCLYGIGTISMSYAMYSIVFMVVSLFLGIVLFTRVEKTFMDTV